MKDSVIIEIRVDNIESAIAAEKGGANRVELSNALSIGGITPSKGLIEQAISRLKIPVHVYIRPREGDFLYSRVEYNIMKANIFAAKVAGASGIVIGMLNSDATVDTCRMKEVVEMCNPLPVTFHRAFDLVVDMPLALEQIIELGCQRIITSGGLNNANEGTENIEKLVLQANGRIEIMPSSGINLSNFKSIAIQTGCKEFQFELNTSYTSKMKIQNQNLSTVFPTSFSLVDVNKVQEICAMAASMKS